MAHLDLAMRPLPSHRFTAVLGIDDAIFVTVPSSVADVAPDGGDVIQVARYLRPGEEHGDHRPGLEAVLDAHQPDWRDHVVDARYVPRSLVSGDHARPATHGHGRPPGVDAAGVRGLARRRRLGRTDRACSPTRRSCPAPRPRGRRRATCWSP